VKRLIKYPLATLFALLMGYTQVFAYVAATAPSPQHQAGTERIQLPMAIHSAMETALLGEIEEDEDYHSSPAVSPVYDLLAFRTAEPFIQLAHRFPCSPTLASSRDFYLRSVAIRL